MILESEGRFVEIIILHRNNLESIDIEDANWLDAEIKINVPGFKGYYNANLRTDDFERFYKDLNKLKTDRFFQIEFTTMDLSKRNARFTRNHKMGRNSKIVLG